MANAGTVEVEFRAAVDRFIADISNGTRAVKGMESGLKSLERNANIALRFLAGSVLVGFAKQAFTAADAISEAAERAGVAVESFSRLKFAAQQNDVEMDALITGLRKFQIEISRAAIGGNSAASSFDHIGLSGKKLKDLAIEQQLFAVADAFQKISSPADRVAVATDLFGKAGEQLIPFLLSGSSGIRKLTEEADKLGITMSGVTAAGVGQADLAIKRLHSTVESFSSRFVAGLSIAILGAPDEAIRLDDRIRQLIIRRDQLLQGGVGKGAGASSLGKSAYRAELEKVNEELARLQAQQHIALGGISLDKTFSRGPQSRNPKIDIKRQGVEEIDLKAIEALKIPEDPFGLRMADDQRVIVARARDEFRKIVLGLAEDLAASQKDVEAGVTSDLQEQLALRSQAVADFQSRTLAAENAMRAARENALASGLQALQAFAGQSKKIAIALVLINKAKAISMAIQNTLAGATLQLTTGDPYTAVARAAAVKAWGALQVAGIVASGFGEIQAINRNGGAPLGSPSNPVNTLTASADQQLGATSQRAVQVIIANNFGLDQRMIDQLIAGIREAADDRDVIIFGPDSRQAREIVGG